MSELVRVGKGGGQGCGLLRVWTGGSGHTRGTGVGGAQVPLHHEDILELLFDESHSGMRIWGYVGKVWGELS